LGGTDVGDRRRGRAVELDLVAEEGPRAAEGHRELPQHAVLDTEGDGSFGVLDRRVEWVAATTATTASGRPGSALKPATTPRPTEDRGPGGGKELARHLGGQAPGHRISASPELCRLREELHRLGGGHLELSHDAQVGPGREAERA